jgi:pilus assembly protein CpaB
VKIVVANRDLPAGVALTAQDVSLADWPASNPVPGSFDKIERVVGRPVIYPLGPKEPVLERDLAVAGSGIGLSAKIPAGMRATSVRSNEIVGVAGFLYPGSHVDVLATYNVPGNQGPVTQTVLQNVEVLTAGEKIEPDPQGKPQTVNVVTLLLTPEDSQKLLLTSTQGTIQFVLRSGADQGKVDVPPTRLEQLVAGARPAAPPPAPAPKVRKQAVVPAAPKAPEVYTLEVIQGDKRSVEKF